MTTPTDDQQKLEAASKALFDDSVDELDAATLSRLNQARQRALEELTPSRSKALWLRWVPATGVAAAALVTVMVVQGPSPDTTASDPLTASDFELLLETDSLEMLEELEFYSWLEMADLEELGDVG